MAVRPPRGEYLAVNSARLRAEPHHKLEPWINIRIERLLLLALTGAANAASFSVTNTHDAGAGSLRQATLSADASAGAGDSGLAPSAPNCIVLNRVIQGLQITCFSGSGISVQSNAWTV